MLFCFQYRRGLLRSRTLLLFHRFVAREAQMIQEIYNGMSRMEERIEALETILLEKDGKEKRS